MTEDTQQRDGDVSDDDLRDGIDRRDYIRAVGASTVVGLLGGSAAGDGDGSDRLRRGGGRPADQDNQTGPLTVDVVDANGDPVSGATVDVEMTEHDFTFGTAIGDEVLIDQFSEGEPFREKSRSAVQYGGAR